MRRRPGGLEAPALIVTDQGYLRRHRRWRDRVAAEARCAVEQVESNVVVPVEEASAKNEWAAATFRPRVRRLLDEYLRPLASPGLSDGIAFLCGRGYPSPHI